MKTNKKLIVIAGPTGVGKTDLAIELAVRFGTEIVSADARQVYKELEIGVAKPGSEQQAACTHHLISNVSIHEHYNAGRYAIEAYDVITNLFTKHNTVVLCGGSGLYIDALLNGLHGLPVADSELRNQLQKEYEINGLEWLQLQVASRDIVYYESMDKHNYSRLLRVLEIMKLSGKTMLSLTEVALKKEHDFEVFNYLIDLPREVLYDRINKRTEVMMESGWLQECNELVQHKDLKALQTVGYSELFAHINGDLTLAAAVDKIKQHTRNYAKRQLTWFSAKRNYYAYNKAVFEREHRLPK